MIEEIEIGSLWILKDPLGEYHFDGTITRCTIVSKVIHYNPITKRVQLISKSNFGFFDFEPRTINRSELIEDYERIGHV